MRKSTPFIATLAITFTLGLGLSACGQGTAQSSENSTSQATSTQVDAAPLTFDDAWVKAAEDGMTGVFGELKNNTDKDINLVEAKFTGAEMVQLHETADDGSGAMSMQEKDGGFVIKSGESMMLEPGGDHIMVMGLTKPIKPGEEISLELVTADKVTIPVTAVAKEYSGAQENYAPGEAEGGDDGAESKNDEDSDMKDSEMKDSDMKDDGDK